MLLRGLKAPAFAGCLIVGLGGAALAQTTPTSPPATPGHAAGPAPAATPGTTATPAPAAAPAPAATTTGAANTTSTAPGSGGGFDWGWLGLLGLLGLAGLRRRNPDLG